MASRPRRIALKPDFQVSRIASQSLASPVNMFAEMQSGKGAFPLHGHPGCIERMSLNGPIRGQETIDGVHYVVAGGSLYRVSGVLSTVLGSVAGSGPVQIVPNRFEVAVVASPRLYVLDRATEAFSEVTTTDDNGFRGCTWMCVLNGIGVFGEPGGDRYNVTGINAFSSINPTGVATAESRSDPLVAGVVASGVLYLMGTDTVELYDNAPSVDSPFARTLVIDIGAVSRETVRVIGSEVFFVGSVPSGSLRQVGVFKLRGGSPVKVSTPPVDRMLEACGGNIGQATSVVWGIDGHVFYRVNTPAGSVEFDLTTELWTRVASGVWGMDAEPAPCTLTSYARVDGVGCFGDATGRLLDVSFDAHDVGEDTLVREFTCPVTGDLGAETIVDEVELYCETGVGAIGRDPVVYESHSKDGGHSWSQPRAGTVQKVGRYGRRVYWDRLGTAADWILRFRMTDASPFKVTGVMALVEAGLRP